jgi:hypothetical protein
MSRFNSRVPDYEFAARPGSQQLAQYSSCASSRTCFYWQRPFGFYLAAWIAGCVSAVVDVETVMSHPWELEFSAGPARRLSRTYHLYFVACTAANH